MNWKAEAAEKLRLFDAMRRSLVSIPEEIHRLESVAQGLRGAATDKTPVKGGGSRREDTLLNNIVLRQELQRKLAESQIWVENVRGALSVLSPRDRLVLLRLYICPEKKAMERLCAELGIEKSSLYRYRDRALEKFTCALYGVKDQQECFPH